MNFPISDTLWLFQPVAALHLRLQLSSASPRSSGTSRSWWLMGAGSSLPWFWPGSGPGLLVGSVPQSECPAPAVWHQVTHGPTGYHHKCSKHSKHSNNGSACVHNFAFLSFHILSPIQLFVSSCLNHLISISILIFYHWVFVMNLVSHESLLSLS